MFSDDLSARHLDSGLFSIWSKPEFLRDFTRRIEAAPAGSRIVATTMAYVQEDPLVKDFVRALTHAASRGVDVLLLIDAYAFLISDDSQPFSLGPLFYGQQLDAASHAKPQFREPYHALQALSQAGGRYIITNPPTHRYSLPIAGRSHIKLYMINDEVFIGGCNLNSSSNIDLTLSWPDDRLARQLHGLANSLADSGNTRHSLGQDRTFAIDAISRLIIDSGQRGRSAIQDEAIALISQAEQSIFLTCQFFPGGRVAHALRQARRRGVKIDIVFNDPSRNGPLRFLQYASIAAERLRNPAEFFAGRLPKSSPYLHAKLLASEKAFMLGSHNYVDAGVRLGTAELTLRRNDPALSARLIDAIKRQTFSASSQHQ